MDDKKGTQLPVKTISYRLTHWERSWLMFLAQHGGETRFNKGLVAPHVVRALDTLRDRDPPAMVELPIAGNEVRYRLTDVGRNLCALIAEGANVKV